MPQIVINSWLGGIAPSDRIGKEGSYYLGEQADPTREIGYLEPGIAGTTLAKSNDDPAIISNYINSIKVDSSNTKAYLLEYGTKLHQSTYAGVLTNDSDFPHTIGDDLTGHGGHTTFKGEDIILYPIGSTHYLFYSWNDNTDGDVGRVNLTSPYTFEDDNLSNTVTSGAVLTKGVPHPMMEWQENGKLYIANGEDLVEIDGQTGANGTADMTAFSLPEGWKITALFPTGDLIGICASYTTGVWSWTGYTARSAVFFWDGSSTKWTRKVIIPDDEIRAAQTLNEDYYIFTKSSSSASGFIRKWDGQGFRLVQKIQDNSTLASRAPAGFGCVGTYKDFLVFSVDFYGKVFLYGSPEPGVSPALYQITKSPGGGTDQFARAVGVVGGLIFFSSRDDSESVYYLTKLSTGYDKNFVYKSLYYEFPQKIRINYVRLYFKTLTSGADDDIKIETNYGDTTTTLGSISYASDGAIEYKRFNKILTCHNFRIIIDTDEGSSTTGIRYGKIVIDYDKIGDSD